jgi:hypothetical protein
VHSCASLLLGSCLKMANCAEIGCLLSLGWTRACFGVFVHLQRTSEQFFVVDSSLSEMMSELGLRFKKLDSRKCLDLWL